MKSYFGVNAGGIAFFNPMSGYLIDAMKPAEPHYASGGYVWGDLPLRSTLTVQFDGTGTVSGKKSGEQINADKLFKVSISGDVRNLRLLRAAGDTFTAEGKASLAPAGTVRLMDWLRTNDSPVVRWSDRCKPEEQTWSKPNGGPYEPWLDYAVANGKDLWLNIPHQADDDYVRQLAALCKAKIGDAPVNLYLEDSNEVWNWQFGQTKWQSAKGGQKWHADRTVCIAREFRKVFGAADKRIRPVLGCGVAHPSQRDEALAHLGTRTSELYGLAIAPYFGAWMPAGWERWTAQRFADHAIESANRYGTAASNTTTGVRQYKTICDAKGLKLLAYEGGLDFNQGTTNVTNKAASQMLPGVGQAIETYLEWWRKEGGDVFCYFNQISLWNQSGVWGLESLPGQRGPKWQAWAKVAARHSQQVEPAPAPTPTPTPRPTPALVLSPPTEEPDGRLKWGWSAGGAPYTLHGPGGWSTPSSNEDAYSPKTAGAYYVQNAAGFKSNTVTWGAPPVDPFAAQKARLVVIATRLTAWVAEQVPRDAERDTLLAERKRLVEEIG